MQLSDKEQTVLSALTTAELTVDEFLGSSRYVNSWAPVFSGLKDRGLIGRTGERRETRYGAEANVLRLTPLGESVVA